MSAFVQDEPGWRETLRNLKPPPSGRGRVALPGGFAESTRLAGWLPGKACAALVAHTTEALPIEGYSFHPHLAVADFSAGLLLVSPADAGRGRPPIAVLDGGVLCRDSSAAGDPRHVLFPSARGFAPEPADLPGPITSVHPRGTHALVWEREGNAVVRLADRRLLRRLPTGAAYRWSCERAAWRRGEELVFASLESDQPELAVPGVRWPEGESHDGLALLEDGRVVDHVVVMKLRSLGPGEPSRWEQTRRICVLDPPTGAASVIELPGGQGAPHDFTLSRDGRALLAIDIWDRGHAFRFPLDRPGVPPFPPRPPKRDLYEANWHPHADLFAAELPRREGVEIRDADGAAVARLAPGACPVAWTGDGRGLLVDLRGELLLWSADW